MNIQTLPQFTPLVKDYLNRFGTSAIGEFFAVPPDLQNEAWLKPFLNERCSSFSEETRAAIVNTIKEQHEALGILNEKVNANLQLLAQPNTLAIVTGQQVGLFGGPLYTLYKTATAIGIAQELTSRYPNYNFVPIFWLETEDHDFDEIASTLVLNQNQEPEWIRYALLEKSTEESDDDDASPFRKQAGSVVIENELLTNTFATLEAALPKTDFTQPLLDALRECYKPGNTFAQSFAKLIHSYFKEYGLLQLDATAPSLKKLALPLFKREIVTSPALSEQIILQTAKLEDHYHAQVKPKAINLFYVDKGERHLIVERERGNERTSEQERSFFLKGTRKSFTYDELLKKLNEEPEKFSPNVVMRPLYQDTILPTAAYVAGPGEIAYFAQFRAGYNWAELPMPLIAPRVSATIIEERLEKPFKKAGTRPEAVLIEGRAIIDRLLAALMNPQLPEKFEEANAAIDSVIESLREEVASVDPTLSDALTSMKGKLLTTVKDFLGKTQSAERKLHATVKGQLEKLVTALLPEGALQERVGSPLYFQNKYGERFSQALIEEVIWQSRNAEPEHHILYLKEVLEGRHSGEFSTENQDSESNLVVEKDEKNGSPREIVRTSEGGASLVAVAEEESA